VRKGPKWEKRGNGPRGKFEGFSKGGGGKPQKRRGPWEKVCRGRERGVRGKKKAIIERRTDPDCYTPCHDQAQGKGGGGKISRTATFRIRKGGGGEEKNPKKAVPERAGEGIFGRDLLPRQSDEGTAKGAAEMVEKSGKKKKKGPGEDHPNDLR